MSVSPSVTGPEQQCDHLFIAMVGNVGSGVTTNAGILKTKLENEYGYTVQILRMSEFIESSKEGIARGLKNLAPADKVDAYQTCGNDLRSKYGNDYLARRAIFEANANPISLPRYAYIFDSFKHPDEIATLKRCYEERLLTITVFCPARIRKSRLENKGIPSGTIDNIFSRDEHELEKHGQKVRDTAYLSDFFIRNSSENTIQIEKTISRYLEVIFGTKIHSPTYDESGMAKAFGAAANSACMSRQVGASVYDKDGKLLATGCNDVPKFGGGIYGEDGNPANDNRCYNWRDKVCHNDFEKSEIYKELVNTLFSDKALGSDQTRFKDAIIERLKSTRVKDLIEFSRSVHAEMDALVSVSRHGTGSTIDGTLFSKTFPCHNCARHIVASGITRVVFVEPYPKSLALKLHSDSITVRDEDATDHVFFVQYEGVSPKVFSRFFSVEHSRKSNGKVREIFPTKARPIGIPASPSYTMDAQRLGISNP
jgi:deoxycytidylate deaminase